MLKNTIRLKSNLLNFLILFILISCNVEGLRENPKACFNYSPVDAITTSDSIQFTNCSDHSNYYFWDFGDDNISFEKEPKHLYKLKKSYVVKLLVAYKSGDEATTLQNSDTISKLIHVSKDVPKACFNFNDSTGFNVTFTNCSEKCTTYLWDFGDGTSSMDKDPTHVYTLVGSYIVKLISTNDGLTDSISKIVVVTDEISLHNTVIDYINYTYSGDYPISVDGDNIADFGLRSLDWSNMKGTSKISGSYITPFNNYKIFSDSLDVNVTNHLFFPSSPNYSIWKCYIPKIYFFGDTIKYTNKTINSGYPYFCRYSFDNPGPEYSYNIWVKDEIRYVGFSIFVADKTRIGWIKLKVVAMTKMILISYKIPTECENLIINK